MKKRIFLLVVAAGVCFSAGFAQAAFRSSDQAAGINPSTRVDKTQLEGWIIRVDCARNHFRLLDPRGFERTVTPKAGTITEYRSGDRVKVMMRQNYPHDTLIEKL